MAAVILSSCQIRQSSVPVYTRVSIIVNSSNALQVLVKW